MVPTLEMFHRQFEAEILEVDRAIVAYLNRFEWPPSHYGMIRYHFGYADRDLRPRAPGDYLPRGKRLRPLICNLFCRLFKLPADTAVVVIMATEVMHAASLTHDDIEDHDAVRWGRPTIQSAFGLEQAINAGDAMIGMVYQLLLSLGSSGVEPRAVVEVLQVFNATHLRMCEGQHLDLRYRYSDDLTVAEYLDMVSRKTAAPCVCIADAISILASSPPQARETLRRFGHNLGVLYQICDDIRGIWCAPDALGRQVGQDVNQRRASLPLLYGFKHGSPALREVLQKGARRSDQLGDADLEFIRTELSACGAGRLCHEEAVRYYEAALAALAELGQESREVHILRGVLSAAFASVDVVA
jgi:geranylgeranyl diphosphate synthase, type I